MYHRPSTVAEAFEKKLYQAKGWLFFTPPGAYVQILHVTPCVDGKGGYHLCCFDFATGHTSELAGVPGRAELTYISTNEQVPDN